MHGYGSHARVNDVVNDPVLGDAARLLFPAEGCVF